MLAFGAAVGGLVVGVFGIQTAFILDAFTFLLSAWFISQIPNELEKSTTQGEKQELGSYRKFIAGMRYLFSEPIILGLSLLKTGLAISGGIMTLIPISWSPARRPFLWASASCIPPVAWGRQ
jgi:hypothetical protein